MKKMLQKMFKDKEFFLTMLTLAIPITFQNLISSSLNMIDNLMIGKLGENTIAAVGLVNQYFFVFMLFLSGINAGAGIFISQYHGRKDIENIRKMFGLDMIMSIAISFIFFLIAILFPESIIKIFTKDPLVISIGIKYLKIISITFLFTGISQAYSTLLRSIGIARPSMYGSLIGILINASLNWVLIFGHFGFPPMGVAGAAIATMIARFFEFIYVTIFAYKANDILPAKLKALLGFDISFIRRYFKTSTSVIINEIVWVLGITTYSIIYAKIGIREVASMQIAITVNNMFMVLCIGIATAASIMIGNQIGAGREDKALDYALWLGVITPIIGVISGLLLWASAPYIVSIFNVSSDTISMTVTVLKIMAVFSPLRFFNVLMIIGIFRGGGDTTYSMLVQLGTIWFLAIPAGYIGAVYFNLSLPQVFFIISLEEVFKIGFEMKRLTSKKWIRKIL